MNSKVSPPAEQQRFNAELEALFAEHNHWLVAWLKQKVSCPETAADVAQDTFMRIIKARDALLTVRKPRAYLATTAKRLIIDRARREVLEKRYLEHLALAVDHLEGYHSPELVSEAIDALQEISQVLESFPAKVQQAFLLYYLGGKSQQEIAEQLAVSSRSVRGYLVKVLVKCQQLEL